MKPKHYTFLTYASASLLVLFMLLMSGCDMLRPIAPQTPSQPGKESGQNASVVTYNYNNTDKVQLSANDLTLKVGQKLILQPAPGLTNSTRFSSSGEYFFGDIMKQESDQPDSGKVTFTAIKPGRGKLQIIPNNTETERATDLWVTVK